MICTLRTLLDCPLNTFMPGPGMLIVIVFVVVVFFFLWIVKND